MNYFYYNDNLELIQISDRDLDSSHLKVAFEATEPQDTEEFKLAVLRAKRDALLKADDGEKLKYYTQKTKDNDAQRWSDLQDYWQALRDLPSTVNLTGKKISDINDLFPTKP